MTDGQVFPGKHQHAIPPPPVPYPGKPLPVKTIRPAMITVVAVIMLLLGGFFAVNLVQAGSVLLRFPALWSSAATIVLLGNLVLVLITAGLHIVLGISLWQMKAWAWKAAVLFLALRLVLSCGLYLLSLAAYLRVGMRMFSSGPSGNPLLWVNLFLIVVFPIVYMFLLVAMLLILRHPTVRQAFLPETMTGGEL